MTEHIRLCCDCKYYKRDWLYHLTGAGDTYDKCFNPLVTGNVVTGGSNGQYCDTTRRFHECGMIGKLWEAK
jgi:hypothetical protein